MDKIQNTHDAEYWNNAHLCSSILRGWHKIKPNNEETKAVMTALQEMTFYVARLKHDAQAKDKIVQEYKLERNKWCMRAQQAERRFDNAEKLIDI
mgnify:FL=1